MKNWTDPLSLQCYAGRNARSPTPLRHSPENQTQKWKRVKIRSEEKAVSRCFEKAGEWRTFDNRSRMDAWNRSVWFDWMSSLTHQKASQKQQRKLKRLEDHVPTLWDDLPTADDVRETVWTETPLSKRQENEERMISHQSSIPNDMRQRALFSAGVVLLYGRRSRQRSELWISNGLVWRYFAIPVLVDGLWITRRDF